MNILGIETSCDDTTAAVVCDGYAVRSSVMASQIRAHRKFGGVVPELASRLHTEHLHRIIRNALTDATVEWNDIDAVAVTCGPGLEGALLVGLAAAKTIAQFQNIPLVGVNHLHGHISSAFLDTQTPPKFPFIALIVSGGHTTLVSVKDHFDISLLGQTRDDAIGECFDKVARGLGLPYPGGPSIQEAAISGDVSRFSFPIPMPKAIFEFSFSGLKTAVLQTIRQFDPTPIADIAASFQYTAVKSVVDKVVAAVKYTHNSTVVVCGGVTANAVLRSQMESAAAQHGFCLTMPPISYCTDNAAMIASAGFFQLQSHGPTPTEISVNPQLRVDVIPDREGRFLK